MPSSANHVKYPVALGGLDQISDPLDFKTPDCVLHSTPTRIPKGFTITTDSYISLCSRVYAATRFKDSDFADHISESAFQWYAVLILWKRLVDIQPSSTERGTSFFREISWINDDPCIPIPLMTYLKGIGHFRDPDGADRQFLLPVFPSSEEISGIRYTFGKVNAKTHCFYEAFPAPAIVILRMLADIKYTKDACKANLLWDLPQGLRPDVLESKVESSMPTTNLLGWAPAQILTENQMQLFETMNIDYDKVVTQKNFRILGEPFSDLFNKIHHYFLNSGTSPCGGIPGTVRFNLLPSTGSLVQGMSIEKHNKFSKFDRSQMYCEGSISVSSPYKLNDELNKGAVISGYRMAKEPISNRHCWSCYDFDEYKSVPESWICSRNRIHMYGNVGRFNETAVYTTGHINKRVLQNNCIQHTMFSSTTNWNLYV